MKKEKGQPLPLTHRLQVNLADSMYESLRELAHAERSTIGAIVRRAIAGELIAMKKRRPA